MAYTKIKLKGDTAVNWTSNNPILADREVGLETDTREFKVGNGTDNWATLEYFNKYDIPQDLLDNVKANTDELTRIKTLINDEKNDVYSYRGSSAVAPPASKKAYYLSFYGLADGNTIQNLPSGSADGTIVSIDNADPTNVIKIAPAVGDKINDSTVLSLSLAANSMMFLIKVANGWTIAYQGLLIKSLDTLINTIKANIPATGTTLTIDEIKAALKDRLHLFSEIQTEFADQLHTLIQIKTYIETELSDKLHTFDKLDAHFPDISLTAADVRDKLSTLTDDDRLDASAIKNIPTNSDQVNTNTDEINRLKTLINNEPTDVFTLRGSDSSILPNDKKAYYVSMYNLQNDTKIITLPQGSTEGTVVSIHNEDITNPLDYKAAVGETINGSPLSLKINAQELVFLVKQENDWVTAFKGLLPNDIGTLIDDIKSNLPVIGTALTIPEIQAALSDRLHTFREIQTEFSNQLHTYSDLIYAGFERADFSYGFLDNAVPPVATTWRVGQGLLARTVFLNVPNTGDKHIIFMLADNDAPLVSSLDINDVDAEYTISDYSASNLSYKLFITKDKYSTASNIKVKFNFGIEHIKGSGITLDDGTTNVSGIDTLNLDGAKITGYNNKEAELRFTAAISVGSVTDVNTIITEEPLKVTQGLDEQGQNIPGFASISLDHSSFEKRSVEGFYGCLSEEVEIVGKNKDILDLYKGDVWFDDVIVPNKGYIALDRIKKAYGIEEDDELDPNVTGGSNVLIYGRIAMRENAADDGFVRIELVNRDTKVALNDINGNPIAFEKHYKRGNKLGFIDYSGIINVKGQTFFNIQVSHTFKDDNLVLEDRTEGNTCLMIQYLDKNAKTSKALLQLENDLNINIEFTSHWIGDYLASINYIKTKLGGLTNINTGEGLTAADGWGLYNITPMRAGYIDGNLLLEDDGSNICYYNLHKIFSAEKTRLLRGKQITVSATLSDKSQAFDIYLAKWTGKANEYTSDIITGISGTTLTLAANWDLQDSDRIFIPEDVVQGDHTVTGDMTVPSDAENFAILIVPDQALQPSVLSLNELRVDAKVPFTGYVLNSPTINDEEHLKYSKQYKEFIQDNQSLASLRYTINDVADGLPMPCGILGKGLADITLDDTVNQVPGSAVDYGQGAIKFLNDGTAIINTQLRISNEQAGDLVSVVKFWWAKVNQNGDVITYEKIQSSEGTFNVHGGTKNAVYNMPTFNFAASKDNRIALRALSDKADGAYIESSEHSKPMVVTKIEFDEYAISDDTGLVKYEDFDTNDFVIAEDNKVTIKEMQNIQDRLDTIDMEIVVTDNAKANGWYVELDVDSNGRPSLSPKQRSNP